jgi:uracil-DNA glycosylase
LSFLILKKGKVTHGLIVLFNNLNHASNAGVIEKEVIMSYLQQEKAYLDSGLIENYLAGTDILVLKEFTDNKSMIEKFSRKYGEDNHPKIVLCGLNPGRFGAGKTGIPFIDYDSLSCLIDGVTRHDKERSAQFFYDVVQTIGPKLFYETFYVTNVSFVGYTRQGKNLNYYDLPDDAKAFVYSQFRNEMEQVAPSKIVSLGGAVKRTVTDLFSGSDIDISHQLPHPNYCAFPKNYAVCKRRYIELLQSFLKG